MNVNVSSSSRGFVYEAKDSEPRFVTGTDGKERNASEAADVQYEHSKLKPPTALQLATLRFIVRQIAERGYPPTVREIQGHFGLRSSYSITCRLRWMTSKGFLRRAEFGASRAYVVTDAGYRAAGFELTARKGAVAQITGHVDPAAMRCEMCARVLFGSSHVGHVCLAEDVESVRGSA